MDPSCAAHRENASSLRLPSLRASASGMLIRPRLRPQLCTNEKPEVPQVALQLLRHLVRVKLILAHLEARPLVTVLRQCLQRYQTVQMVQAPDYVALIFQALIKSSLPCLTISHHVLDNDW
jgi:hypothetical protein